MRKRTVRKHYNLVNVIDLAISGATITTEADLDKLRLRELSAIEAFAKGNATRTEFRDLCDLLNLCETFAVTGVGPEARAACDAAQQALIDIKDRHDRTGVLGATGPGLAALRDVYAWHDAQRTAVDRSTYERAIKKTRDRIKGAHPGVKVLA